MPSIKIIFVESGKARRRLVYTRDSLLLLKDSLAPDLKLEHNLPQLISQSVWHPCGGGTTRSKVLCQLWRASGMFVAEFRSGQVYPLADLKFRTSEFHVAVVGLHTYSCGLLHIF